MTRNSARWMAICSAAVVAGGCSDSSTHTTPFGPTADLRVAQTVWSATTVSVQVGSATAVPIAPGAVSAILKVPVGAQTVHFVPSGGTATGSTRDITFEEGKQYFIVAQDSSGVVVPTVLADTNAIPVPGKSKLRVVHSAALAPALDIWRRQPDYDTLVRVQFPFPYRAVSPYIQSDPGDWHVTVSHENLTDTLYASPTITVADGKLVTVVVIDSSAAGGVSALVIPDN